MVDEDELVVDDDDDEDDVVEELDDESELEPDEVELGASDFFVASPFVADFSALTFPERESLR
ncbi:hypothetical protein ACFY36_21535 [Actinoplanes sp. NPDC000266]